MTWARAAVWARYDSTGLEFADIACTPTHLSAEGVAIADEPLPYRIDYTLETGPEFVTSRLQVTCRGERWRRVLDLRRSAAGAWTIDADGDGEVDLPAPGGDPVGLHEALDCDLALSPVTNLMPILRDDLLVGGGPVELVTAWVSVPDLSVRADGQRYSFVRSDEHSSVVTYEAVDGSFSAQITLDRDGVVIDYPGIARRLDGPVAPKA